MKLLILGSSGFIGKHLVKRLYNDGHELTCFDRFHDPEPSLEDLRKVEGLFTANTDFDALVSGQEKVYHLISSSFPNSDIAYDVEIAENVLVTIKLLKACVRQGVKQVIFVSSGGTVYGEPKGMRPFKETDETLPIAPYGVQKLMIEKYLHLFYHHHSLDYKVIRLANPYGPGQNPKGSVGAIAVLLNRALYDELITIFGDGSSVRDYIYIDDAVSGIVNISMLPTPEKVYNLGSGQGTSLVTILDKIKLVTKKELNLTFLPKRSADLAYSVLDTSLYQECFPQHQMTSLEEGISQFYCAMLEEGE